MNKTTKKKKAFQKSSLFTVWIEAKSKCPID